MKPKKHKHDKDDVKDDKDKPDDINSFELVEPLTKSLDRKPSISVNNTTKDDTVKISFVREHDELQCCSGSNAQVSNKLAVLGVQIGTTGILVAFCVTALSLQLPYSVAYGSGIIGSLLGYWFSKSKEL